VKGFLGIVAGAPSEINLGALPAIYSLTGFVGYVLGGLLFGLATLRAGVLPRWAGGLLAFAAVSVLAAPLLGHPRDRTLAVPMGLALAWLGYALWSERRDHASEPVPNRGRPQLRQTGAE
jgi:membrane protein implicated in regulation of membrane protease activity